MSTVDEKAKEVPVGEAGDADQAQSGKSDRENAGGFIILFFILGLAASMVVGWVVFPKLLYSQKEQPIQFNHVLHMAEVEDGCTSCHFLRDDGSFSGVPKLAQCVECHEEPLGESESEAVFVEQYVSQEREVPWLIYSKQPDCVFFSHAAHIKGANLDCVTCHGHIGETESLRPYEENRLTGVSRDVWGRNIAGFKKNTWDRMKMDDCAECHEGAGIHDSSVQTERDACFVCHK